MIAILVLRDELTMSGHGSGVVVGTGKDTEFGVVFEMMQDVSVIFSRHAKREGSL